MPIFLRNLKCTQDRFKSFLDLFLQEIPDNPNGKDYVSTAMNHINKPSNSIRDWSRTLKLSNWRLPLNHLTPLELDQFTRGGLNEGGTHELEDTMH